MAMANDYERAIAGMSFPFRIDPVTGSIAWASGSDKIRQNILLILGTRSGERPMLRNIGTRLRSLLHDPNDDVLVELVSKEVQDALLIFEPRILVTGVSTEQSEGVLFLRLSYIHTALMQPDEVLVPIS